MNVLPLFLRHLNNFIRRFVPKDTNYFLTLDGHASRKGFDWVQLCSDVKCEAVLASANTLHFLQPCDQAINKTFRNRFRVVKDELMRIASDRFVRQGYFLFIATLQTSFVQS